MELFRDCRRMRQENRQSFSETLQITTAVAANYEYGRTEIPNQIVKKLRLIMARRINLLRIRYQIEL